jgi:hypothetical protein
MKIDVTQPIKEYDGRDIVDPSTGQPAPLRTFLVNALATAPSDTSPNSRNPDQPTRMTTESKERRFGISTKLWSKKNVDLKSTEIAFIIECVDAAYDNPLICGRVKQVLEGEGQSVPESDETTADQASSDHSMTDGAQG